MAKVKSVGATGQATPFTLVPKQIKIKNGQTKIKVAVIPPSPMSSHAQLIGRVLDNKSQIEFTSPLKSLMKKVGWVKSDFKPLLTTIQGILNQSKTQPQTVVEILDTYLKSGTTPNFSVQYLPSNSCTPASTFSLQTAPQPVQSLNFTVVPSLVKVKNSAVKIGFAAFISAPCFGSSGQLTATISGSKPKLSYDDKMLALLAKINWNVSNLTPLEDYVTTLLSTSRANPEIPIAMLNTYLSQGYAPTIVVTAPQAVG